MKRAVLVIFTAIFLLFTSGCNKKPAENSSGLNSDFSSVQNEIVSSGISQPQSSSSSAVSSEEQTGGLPWKSNKLLLKNPENGGYLSVNSPVFTCSNIGAESYTFYLEEKNGSSFFQIKKITVDKPEVRMEGLLKAGTTYSWHVEAVKDGKTIRHSDSTERGALFMAVSKKNDKDYSFDGKISEQVLKNYLSKALTLSYFSVPSGATVNDVRIIFNTGAKYISRAAIPWEAETEYEGCIARYKELIDEVHNLDSDIIFETCIFETVFKSCEQVSIPGWVFEVFGKVPENRNFSYQKMLFPNGKYINEWGNGGSVPDITQLETQMYFYYRACRYIDAGFEAIHWGQVMLMGETDTNHQSYSKVLTMVRAYAKTHARRHFVLNNAHTYGLTGPDGVLLFDFHAYVLRMKAKTGEAPHAPTESNPQKTILESGYLDTIYNRSLGGKTVSGWSTSSLPYFVEVDNVGIPYNMADVNKPGIDYWPWGMDEISWFANQPKSYRQEWLRYAYNWIRSIDPQGYFCITGSRPYYSLSQNKIIWYHASSSEFWSGGYDDENMIKEIFMNY